MNPDGLLCALVLAPNTFARNRFFGMFENPALRRVRRRAYHVRSVLRQLLGQGKERALLIGRAELDDSRVLLRYRIENLKMERSTALSALEAAVLSFALHRAGQGDLEEEDRERVERALQSLGSEAPLDGLG
ncbi:MAG TPA: hypothetical protein VG963_29430 [Polyangiaceae bacterium]|nr:hypothetical protein [Polyangiaceae bacterium]